MDAFLFYTFAIVTVGGAVLVIVQPNAVGAAMALVASFFGMAALFVLLEAHFVAAMQVLLYAGAIMVFFLFVIMLLNLEPRQLRWRAITGGRIIFGSAAAYLGGLLLVALLDAHRAAGAPLVADGVGASGMAPVAGTVEAVGELLLTRYAIPFEVTSILLLVAIIGAVAMGKKR